MYLFTSVGLVCRQFVRCPCQIDNLITHCCFGSLERGSLQIREFKAAGGWQFQKICLDSSSVEATGKSHPSSGEASADLQEMLQLLGIHRVIPDKFGTTNAAWESAGNANQVPECLTICHVQCGYCI